MAEEFLTCFNFDFIYNETHTDDVVFDDLFKFYNRFEIYHAWITIALSVSGLAGNVVMSLILMRKSMKSTVNVLLTSVAICDSCLLIIYFLYVVHFKFLPDCAGVGLTRPWAIFALFHANLSVVLRAYSLWVQVVIAGYRKTVLYKNQPVLTENNRFAPWAITVVAVGVVVVASPIFFGYSISEETSPKNDSQCGDLKFYRVVLNENLFVYDCFLLKINHFINAILLKLLPCSFLTYYFLSIITLLWKQNRFKRLAVSRRRRSVDEILLRQNRCYRRCRCFRRLRVAIATDNARKLHPTTIILASILLMTLLCELPNALTSALSGLISVEYYWLVYQNLGDLFDVLSLFNGLTTFLTYCTMSSAFRRTILQLFHCSPQSQVAHCSPYQQHQHLHFKRNRDNTNVRVVSNRPTDKRITDNDNGTLRNESNLHTYTDGTAIEECQKQEKNNNYELRGNVTAVLTNRERIVENLFASDDESEV